MAIPAGSWRRAKLTIPASRLSAAHTDFAVLATRGSFSDSELFDPTGANRAQSDARDFRLALDSTGQNEIPFEIADFSYDSSSGAGDGRLELYFLLPSLSAVTDNELYLFYRNSNVSAYAATDPYGRNAVWINEDFVSHDGKVDSTGSHNVTVNGSPTEISDADTIGKATHYTNDTQYADLDNAGQASGDISLRALINYRGGGGEFYQTIVGRRNSGNWNYQWRRKSASSAQELLIGSGSVAANSSTFGTDGSYHYECVTHSSAGQVNFYRDGASVGSGVRSGSVSTPSVPTYLARNVETGVSGDFYYDETRIRLEELSAEWIADEAENLNSPHLFVVASAPEDFDNSTGSYSFSGSITSAAAVNSDHNVGRELSGVIQGGGDILASLVVNRHSLIQGAINGQAAVSSALLFAAHANILGSIQAQPVINANLAYGQSGVFYGFVAGTGQVLSTLAYTHHAAFNGTIVATAGLPATLYVGREIEGNISGNGSVAATAAYQRNHIIAGLLSSSALVTSSLEHTGQKAITGLIVGLSTVSGDQIHNTHPLLIGQLDGFGSLVGSLAYRAFAQRQTPRQDAIRRKVSKAFNRAGDIAFTMTLVRDTSEVYDPSTLSASKTTSQSSGRILFDMSPMTGQMGSYILQPEDKIAWLEGIDFVPQQGDVIRIPGHPDQSVMWVDNVMMIGALHKVVVR